MLNWRYRFPGESPVIWRADVQRDFDQGQSDSARASSGFRYRHSDHVLPAREVTEIERLFQEGYEALGD